MSLYWQDIVQLFNDFITRCLCVDRILFSNTMILPLDVSVLTGYCSVFQSALQVSPAGQAELPGSEAVPRKWGLLHSAEGEGRAGAWDTQTPLWGQYPKPTQQLHLRLSWSVSNFQYLSRCIKVFGCKGNGIFW